MDVKGSMSIQPAPDCTSLAILAALDRPEFSWRRYIYTLREVSIKQQ